LAWFARLAGFPAAVDPEPLVGVLADDGFELAVEGLGVAGGVAGDFERWVETKHVLAFGFGPEGEAGDDGGAGVGGELGEACAGAGGDAEEIDEDTVVERGVLVDQDADGLVVAEGFQDAAGGFAFGDEMVAGEGAAALDQGVDLGVVEWAEDHVHGGGEQGVGEGAELPIAEVRGGEEDAAALVEGGFEVLETFVADPVGDVGGADLREAREGHQQAGDGMEDAVGDAAVGGGVELGHRHGEV